MKLKRISTTVIIFTTCLFISNNKDTGNLLVLKYSVLA